MKKFKKVLLSILSLALVAILSIGGTLAYLKSEDSDVNVMTMGNVKIAQHEYERATNADGSYKTDTIDNQTSYVLQKFTQDKPLYPAVADPHHTASGWDQTTVRMSQVDSYGGMSVFAEPNAQDKFVTVENTGRSAAYVRTLVAIEIGEGDPELIGTSFHQTWISNEIGTIEVDGNKYILIEYLYNGASGVRHENGVLPAKDTTYPSLSQVYLMSEATNEDCEALDGNGNGKLDILVLSQAVQTKGFADAKTALDTAFGETNATNAAIWFGGMSYEKTAGTKEELEHAIEENSEITLSNDIDYNEDYIYVENKNIVINGNNKTLAAGEGTANGYSFMFREGGSAEFNDVNIVGGGFNTFDGKIVFNSGSINVTSTTTNPRYLFYAAGEGAEIVINGGEFDIASKSLKRAYACAQAGATIVINGGTFGGASTRDGYKAGILTTDTAKVIINGGTFGFDPTTWVAAGHTVVNNGNGTWTVQ